jgi:hypothetical protein
MCDSTQPRTPNADRIMAEKLRPRRRNQWGYNLQRRDLLAERQRGEDGMATTVKPSSLASGENRSAGRKPNGTSFLGIRVERQIINSLPSALHFPTQGL